MNQTKIEVTRHSASGSRTCFICEEKITDVTYMVSFRTENKEGIIDRAINQITLHKKCSLDLINELTAALPI